MTDTGQGSFFGPTNVLGTEGMSRMVLRLFPQGMFFLFVKV